MEKTEQPFAWRNTEGFGENIWGNHEEGLIKSDSEEVFAKKVGVDNVKNSDKWLSSYSVLGSGERAWQAWEEIRVWYWADPDSRTHTFF